MKRSFLFVLTVFASSFTAFTFAQTNFNFTPTCYGSQTTLVASSSLPDTSISMWQWDLDGNGSYEVSGKTIISLFAQNGSVPVKLRITPKTGLKDSITKNVVIDPLPQVNFMTNNTCAGKSATFSSQSSITSGSISQFLWDFNNDGITDDNTNDTVNFNCGPAQTFISKLTCVSDKGCAAFAQKTTTVFSNPVAAFSAPAVCLGSITQFSNTSTTTNPDYYVWDFGDAAGNISSGNTQHLYAAAGNYNVQLIAVTQAGCRDTTTSAIIVNALPVVTLTASGDTVFFEGSSVDLTAAGGAGYSWSTGEGTDMITVNATGNYSCVVTDGNGCTAAVSVNILVNEIPDSVSVSGFVLTPNDDNINDALIIDNFSAYSNCNLRVYSMWNDEVFNVKGYQNDWKGTSASGGNLPAGAYYYIILCDDKPLLKGNINILR